ncbi:MAG: bifunctional glutamate N-acetyltransferase/amino-acid acetyltransferase ArgJ [Pseudomonadota bacterium]
MSQSDHHAQIAAKRAQIAELEAEIDAHRRALGQVPGRSPFAPERFPELPLIDGVRFAAVSAGVRYKTGRLDVMLAEIAAGSTMAGTFTKSGTRSAPVLWCQDRIAALSGPSETPVAVVVNAGNANAFTGDSGRTSVETVMQAAGKTLGIPAEMCFMASTGVIGEPLPAERITDKLAELRNALDPAGLSRAADAIMTTDTFPKGSSAEAALDGTTIRVAGIAKGSGMIAPDMATMLVFVFTDAPVAQALLQQTVAALTDQTFNAITVDSDTSTSDTLLVAATGRAGGPPIETISDSRYPGFRDALRHVMHDLAIQVVKDGEGATKFATIRVTGAEDDKAARRLGLAIANSPLVKTALAGEDPNWGRIVMAVGKSGERADRDKLSITFGEILVAENGWVSQSYTEDAGAEYMKRAEVEIGVDVGVGHGHSTVWTCDLSHGYVTINADYRS